MSINNHPTTGNGKVCYVEIPAINVASSATFYKEVFGWHIRRNNDGHIAFDDGVGEVSGTWVKDRKPTTEAGLLIHIMVDNMDETIAAVISNGGKIVQAVGADLPEITARFTDPAGNIIGLYQERAKE